MSTPSWMDAAVTAQKQSETQLPEAGETPMKEKGKSGPKKALVQRKVVGLNFSRFQNDRLSELEMKLKIAGVKLTRGRSEAAELAISYLYGLLNDDGNKETEMHLKSFLKVMVGAEDKYASGEMCEELKQKQSKQLD